MIMQSKKAHSLRQLAYVLFDKMKHNTWFFGSPLLAAVGVSWWLSSKRVQQRSCEEMEALGTALKGKFKKYNYNKFIIRGPGGRPLT